MNRSQRTSLNDLNLSLQGRDSDLFKHGYNKSLHEKVQASQERLDIIISFLDRNYFIPGEKFLELLHGNVVHYFPAGNMVQHEQNVWICKPFQVDITKVVLFAANETQLIDLSCDGNLKGKFA